LLFDTIFSKKYKDATEYPGQPERKELLFMIRELYLSIQGENPALGIFPKATS
jgi:hypothetical protein